MISCVTGALRQHTPHSTALRSSALRSSALCSSVLSISALLLCLAVQLQAQRRDTALVIAVISDTQAPLPIERLLLGDAGNADARELLFADILNGPSLRAVVHLGDMTSVGSLPPAWGAIDRFHGGLTERGVPMLAVPGNHEYTPLPSWGRENFLRRFPGGDVVRLARFGRVALLLFNSNRPQATDAGWREQLRRYAELLDSCERSPDVAAIIVACHHSPHTNSSVVTPNAVVLRDVVPRFLASRKTVLFLSGHAHGAELFSEGGKLFLVSGGGGGSLQTPLRGARQREKDIFPLPPAERSFHYFTIAVDSDALTITARMIDTRRGALRTLPVARIPFVR